jgi:hypothetical protein
MYKCLTRSDRIKAREIKSLEERLVIAMEHLCDLLDDANRKRLHDKW